MIKKMFHHFCQPRPFTRQAFVLVFGALLQLGQMTPARAQEVAPGCGVLSMQGRFGPYDYRVERYIPEPIYRSHKALLFIVENAHFTSNVESLISGKTSTLPGHDISYTLHAFPNHHRALIAIAALSEKEKRDQPFDTPYPVECWFKRAVAWRPDDNIVRLIYANFLVKKSRKEEAEFQLNYADKTAGDNAFTLNNIGLIYFDMKNYPKAVEYAHKAYQLGLSTHTLKEQLQSVGQWSDSTTNNVENK